MASSSATPDADDVDEPGISDVGSEDRSGRTAGHSLIHTGSSDRADHVRPLTLVFVRHGVTDMTLSHHLSGSSGPGPSLNDTGRAQAEAAARAVAAMGTGEEGWDRVPLPTRVIASPMNRTQETAAPIASALGVPVETDARLREIGFGEWEGLTGRDVAERYGDMVFRWMECEVAAPGGESFAEVGERIDRLLVELAREHAAWCLAGDDSHRSVVLVSHAIATKCAVARSMRMDPSVWGRMWPRPASISVVELRVTRDGEIAERHLHCFGQATG